MLTQILLILVCLFTFHSFCMETRVVGFVQIDFIEESISGYKLSKKDWLIKEQQAHWRCPSHKGSKYNPNQFAYKSLVSFFKHIKEYHVNDEGRYTCVYPQCRRNFSSSRPSEIIHHISADHGAFILCCQTLWPKALYSGEHKTQCKKTPTKKRNLRKLLKKS